MGAAAVPLMIASAGIQAFGAIKQGQAAKAAGDYNAAIAEQSAQFARQDAALQMQQQDRENRMLLGHNIAAAGASGIKASGSVLDVLGDAAQQGELQRQNIFRQGEMKAAGYQNTANLDRMQGDAAQQASYYQAAGALLGGGANAAYVGTSLSRTG
jgi:hypothetical protein